MLAVVLAHISEIESLSRQVVELNGSELPLAADAVGNVEVDLRAVEGAVAGSDLVGQVELFEQVLENALEAIPEGVVPEPYLRPGGKLRGVLQVDRLVDPIHQRDEAANLVADLLLLAVDVRVVLRELPNPGEAAQGSRGFVAVQDVLGVQSKRQIPVAALLEPKVQMVRGAVHRLEREVVLTG